MNAYFLDSSSLVKRFAIENGTNWIVSLFKVKPPHRIYVARITFVAVSSALARKTRSGEISLNSEKAAKRLWRAFEYRLSPVEITKDLAEHAAHLARTYFLRGYDAVQLADALEVANKRIAAGMSTLIFGSADSDLNQAASSEDLSVENFHNQP